MQINVTYDQSQASLPSGFAAAVNYVVNYFDTTFTSAVTVNIDLGYGEIAGQSLLPKALGESETYFDSISYSTAVNALKANEPLTDQQSAYATLPSSTPLSGGTLWVSTAEGKALGLVPATDSAIDGYVGIGNTYSFSYSPTATPPTNQYYFVGVLAHEFSEVMGRDSLLGDGLGSTTSYSVMDLFRYASAGVRQLTTSGPAYFSINNGSTNLDSWNTDANGDLGDWAPSAGTDSFLAFSPIGQAEWITQPDLILMNTIGWDTAPPVATILFNFTFHYADGSYYTGEVADNGTYGYAVGETIAGVNGSYYSITSSAGSTTLAVGTVIDTSYFDVTTNNLYGQNSLYNSSPSSRGHTLGTGLGNDVDAVLGKDGQYHTFGDAGQYEATYTAPRATALFNFTFHYADGSYYTGEVADNGTYGYTVGETINGVNGSHYSITSSDGSTSIASGTVIDTSYFDATTNNLYGQNSFYDSSPSSRGHTLGTGLGNEVDAVLGKDGQYHTFGADGQYEATNTGPRVTTLFNFIFHYADGSYYSGEVADNGTYGYTVGETINGVNGSYYSITSSAGSTSLASGTVIDTSYFDATTNNLYSQTSLYDSSPSSRGHTLGTGLGNDLDAVLGKDGQYHTFGHAGQYEAIHTGSTGGAIGATILAEPDVAPPLDPNLGLLRDYMASTFAPLVDGGSVPSISTTASSNQGPVLTTAHI